jgi:hypothetical protein
MPTSIESREMGVAKRIQGLRSAVIELDLARVIHWSRSGGTWIVNVWERG